MNLGTAPAPTRSRRGGGLAVPLAHLLAKAPPHRAAPRAVHPHAGARPLRRHPCPSRGKGPPPSHARTRPAELGA